MYTASRYIEFGIISSHCSIYYQMHNIESLGVIKAPKKLKTQYISNNLLHTTFMNIHSTFVHSTPSPPIPSSTFYTYQINFSRLLTFFIYFRM